MRQTLFIALLGATALSGCVKDGEAEVARAMQDVNVIDETNLNDVMLTVGDPNEAVAYFQRANANDPGRIDFLRGLAKSLVRAGRPEDAVIAWKAVLEHAAVTSEKGVCLVL